jgi:hypothetical protein
MSRAFCALVQERLALNSGSLYDKVHHFLPNLTEGEQKAHSDA